MWQTVQQDLDMTQGVFSRHLPHITMSPINPSNMSIFYQAMADREDESVQPLCISERYVIGWIKNIMSRKRFTKPHVILDNGKLVAYEGVWHREEDGPFFKVYLESIDELHAVKGALDVLVELCNHMDRAANGSLILLPAAMKNRIAEKCKISRGRFDNIISLLVKRNILRREASNIYAMNPTIIAKGYPEEVLKLRKEWGYSNKDFDTVKPCVFRDDETNLVNEIVLAMADKLVENNKNLSAEVHEDFKKTFRDELLDALEKAGIDVVRKKTPDITVVK